MPSSSSLSNISLVIDRLTTNIDSLCDLNVLPENAHALLWQDLLIVRGLTETNWIYGSCLKQMEEQHLNDASPFYKTNKEYSFVVGLLLYIHH